MRVFVLLLFFTSCTHHSNWQRSNIYSQEKNHTSKRFIFTDPIYKEMELEIIVYSDHTKCYLNFFDFSLKEEKEATVTFKTDDLTMVSTGYFFKGGQRLLLSEKDSVKLLDLLRNKKDVSIIYGNYQLDVHCENFTSLLDEEKRFLKKLMSYLF